MKDDTGQSCSCKGRVQRFTLVISGIRFGEPTPLTRCCEHPVNALPPCSKFVLKKV